MNFLKSRKILSAATVLIILCTVYMIIGALTIIVGVAALVLGLGGGYFLCKIVEKKKKQPEVTGDTEKETDDE